MGWRNYTDAVQNRHASWTGEIVRDTNPKSINYGKCFRVTESWYQRPDYWRIWWDTLAPIERSSLPRRTKVWEADGSTWDLKLEWRKAFPKIDFVLCVAATIGVYFWGNGDPHDGWLVLEWCIFWAFIWFYFANVWFFKREPVRGTRLNLTYVAVHEAYRASHADERAQQQAMVPQWQGNDPNYQSYRPYYQPPDSRDLWVAGRGTQPRLHANGMWYWTDHLARDHWSTQRPTGV